MAGGNQFVIDDTFLWSTMATETRLGADQCIFGVDHPGGDAGCVRIFLCVRPKPLLCRPMASFAGNAIRSRSLRRAHDVAACTALVDCWIRDVKNLSHSLGARVLQSLVSF